MRGEVGVTFTSERPERRVPGAVLFAGDRTLVVTSARRHQRRWLVRFEGVDDREAAAALRGVVLTGDPAAGTDDRDALWVHDVVGATVRDAGGRSLGRVVAVQDNPAHDLLVLDDGTLVPAVFVVDRRGNAVVVDIPEGLLDVNRGERR